MERAQGIIDNLEVKAPIDGVVSVKENRDGIFMFFSGMVLPQYREGDTTSSGRNIADVVENGKMEVRAKVTETDRDNLKEGQKAAVLIDALAIRTWRPRSRSPPAARWREPPAPRNELGAHASLEHRLPPRVPPRPREPPCAQAAVAADDAGDDLRRGGGRRDALDRGRRAAGG